MKMPQKQTSKKKKLIIISAIAFLLVGGGTGYALYAAAKNKTDAPRGMNDVDYSPATDIEKQESEQHKADTAPADQKPDTPTESNTAPSPQAQTISVTLVGVTQSEASKPVVIRANIEGTSAGTCEAVFKRTGQTDVTKTFPILFEATTARCQSAEIPSSEFSASGTWDLTLTAKNGSQTSNTASGTVNVKK
jgi:hypothetical protein